MPPYPLRSRTGALPKDVRPCLHIGFKLPTCHGALWDGLVQAYPVGSHPRQSFRYQEAAGFQQVCIEEPRVAEPVVGDRALLPLEGRWLHCRNSALSGCFYAHQCTRIRSRELAVAAERT